MHALVCFRDADGATRMATHGDLIGRLWSAAVHIDDPRVSEAHAMISLRGQELRLLALRGRFTVDGERQTDAVLKAGQVIHLARELALTVQTVELPSRVLALEGPGIPRQVIPGVCSVHTRPQLRLVPRYSRDAQARAWSSGSGWRVQVGDGRPIALAPGDSFEVGGITLRAVAVDLADAGQAATRLQGGIQRPLKLVTMFDTVHIHRDTGDVVAISGIAARILSELAAIGGPVGWQAVASELWPDALDRHALRKKWDISLVRLRRKLRQAGLRSDLVRSDGSGNLELLLMDGDEVEDRS